MAGRVRDKACSGRFRGRKRPETCQEPGYPTSPLPESRLSRPFRRGRHRSRPGTCQNGGCPACFPGDEPAVARKPDMAPVIHHPTRPNPGYPARFPGEGPARADKPPRVTSAPLVSRARVQTTPENCRECCDPGPAPSPRQLPAPRGTAATEGRRVGNRVRLLTTGPGRNSDRVAGRPPAAGEPFFPPVARQPTSLPGAPPNRPEVRRVRGPGCPRKRGDESARGGRRPGSWPGAEVAAEPQVSILASLPGAPFNRYGRDPWRYHARAARPRGSGLEHAAHRTSSSRGTPEGGPEAPLPAHLVHGAS